MTLRKQVLSELGNPTLGAGKKVPRKQSTEGKTDRMLRLEVEHGGVDIKVLIREGTVREAAERLGINFGTVSLWRRELGLSDGSGISGHQMHEESCGPNCHAVSLGRCYAPSCKYPTCSCHHARLDPNFVPSPAFLCDDCYANAVEGHSQGCICLQ